MEERVYAEELKLDELNLQNTKNSNLDIKRASGSVFKEFLIVGVSDLTARELREAEGSSFIQCQAQPTLFYSHIKKLNEAEECERRKVVKDFCFPDGIELKAVKTLVELRKISSKRHL